MASGFGFGGGGGGGGGGSSEWRREDTAGFLELVTDAVVTRD